MRRLTTLALALILIGGVAGCGGSENPCDHPNSVACEEYKRGEEDKQLHNYLQELGHRGQEEHHE